MTETQLQSVPVAGMPARRWASNATILIGSCALVATAYWLGMGWLGDPVLGVPAGVWSVAVVFALLRWGEGVILDGLFESVPQSRFHRIITQFLTESVPAAVVGLRDSVVAVPARVSGAFQGCAEGWKSMGMASRRDRGASSWIDQAEQRLTTCAQSRPVESAGEAMACRVAAGRPRVGLDVPAHLVQRLLHSSGETRINWIPIREVGLRPAELCRLRRLDALVQRQDESLVLLNGEGDSQSGRVDWCEAPQRTTFASVFPLRFDASRVTLGNLSLANRTERDLVAALVEAVVVIDREGRIGAPPAGRRGDSTAAMHRLGEAVVATEPGAVQSPAAVAASRILSAWLCVSDEGPSIEDRRAMLERCVNILAGDAEAHLRLGAGRLAVGEEQGAMSAFRRGQILLSRPFEGSADDQLAFLQSELEHGAGDAMAVGRIAAGLTLLRATLPAEEFAYVSEDLLDDMRFAGWLVGRDPERLQLVRVARALRGDSPSPSATATAA